MDTAKPEQLGPKFPFYRSKHDGHVHAALKFPSGYEDNHPEEYEGVEQLDPLEDEAAREQAEADKAAKKAATKKAK